jgi:replicative DNA helicase
LSRDTFADFGKDYQRMVVRALLEDTIFAEQMMDVIDPKFFTPVYLQEVVQHIYDYKRKYGSYPSLEILVTLIKTSERADEEIKRQVGELIKETVSKPLNGDSKYIKESSLDFCRRQTIAAAMLEALEATKRGNAEAVLTILRNAMVKGDSQDMGSFYLENIGRRLEKGVRKPISTGWSVLDTFLNGGWERQTLTTVIAPTGVGKSHFLVNCSAAGIAAGLNVVYISCEMADWKIELRHDAFFTGVEINDIPKQFDRDALKMRLSSYVTGNLVVKEYPTKRASVETIRAYLQRLRATSGFIPDMVVVDYADILRSTRGFEQKRFELELVYEELRALAQELNVIMITADQTNRGGVEKEDLNASDIGESYAKAQICDLILGLIRTTEHKQTQTGRLKIMKSRLGPDGMIIPILFNPAYVKMILRDPGEMTDPVETFKQENENLQELAAKSYEQFRRK